MTAAKRDVNYKDLTRPLAWSTIEHAHRAALESLDSFVEAHGHARVPAKHTDGEVKLGRRVARWRSEYKLGKLDPKTAVALESKSGWSWAPLAERATTAAREA